MSPGLCFRKRMKNSNNLSGIFSGWRSICYFIKDHTEEDSKQRFFPLIFFLLSLLRQSATLVLFQTCKKRKRKKEKVFQYAPKTADQIILIIKVKIKWSTLALLYHQQVPVMDTAYQFIFLY